MNQKTYCILVVILTIQTGISWAQSDFPAIQDQSPPVSVPDQPPPEREIKYDEELSPEWKSNWDIARELYRKKKYSEALVQYEVLFSQKDDIEEARWEYLTILMHLGRWENAKKELEILTAFDPSSIRYLFAMAKVCKEIGELTKTVDLYTQLLEMPLSDSERKQALEGLVHTYELQGEDDKGYTFLVILTEIEPDNAVLKSKLAGLELDRGNFAEARQLIKQLEQIYPQNMKVLSMLAELEEAQNNKTEAATYWQKIVGLEPENIEAHTFLYMYYLENKNPAMSFKHLEQLIRIAPDNLEYLQLAADINVQLDRLDLALEYYEFALAVDPGNKDILHKKKSLQKIVAKDVLALIENNVDENVWKDLGKVGPDSVGVYREVANLLRERDKVNELIHVLTLILTHVPDDQQVLHELETLLTQQGRLEELRQIRAEQNVQVRSEGNI